MNLVDRAFKLWERTNQPRRAQTRTSACSSSVDCASMPTNHRVRSRNSSHEGLVSHQADNGRCTINW